MRAFDLRPGRLVLALVVAAVAGALFASGAGAARIKVRHVWIPAPVAPGTPSSFSLPGSHLKRGLNLNQVGIIKVGSAKAKNVLVFEPGTSGGGAYIVPLREVARRTHAGLAGVVGRTPREPARGPVGGSSKAKKGQATPAQLFHYYLGYLTESPQHGTAHAA